MADDSTLCNVCRGSGKRSKRVGDEARYTEVMCYACHGTGRWHRPEDRWPYRTTARPL